LQQKHEGGRGAIEDGHFLGRDVDIEVVDAQAAQGDIRCSTVCTLAPPVAMVEAMRVSVTAWH
jgi:hypothetical protein